MSDRNVLKGYFNTGDVPTESQFADLIDSFILDSIEMSQVACPTAAPDRAEGTDGNLTGTYYYTVSFVTAVGETEAFFPPQAITVTGKRVELTNIPIGPSGVIARKIYRGLNTGYEVKHVVTIADNTTTSYSDNIPNAAVTDFPFRCNTTGGYISVNGDIVMAADPSRTSLGYGQSQTGSGIENTTIGKNVGAAFTTGYWCTGVGSECLQSVTTGFENTGIGFRSLRDITTGFYNIGVGVGSLGQLETGAQNAGVGYSAGSRLLVGSSNALFGMGAGQNLLDSNNTVCLGTNAGVHAPDGVTALTYSDKCIYIGDHCRGSSATPTSEIVIGPNAIGLGLNTTVIGNADTVRTRIMGLTEYYQAAVDTISTFARLIPSGTSTSRGKGISIEILAQPTDQNSTFIVGQLYSIFDGSTYDSARTTLRGVNGVGGFDDVLTLKNGKIGIKTNSPTVEFEVNGVTKCGGYLISALPDVSVNIGGEIRITDRGERRAYCDGVNWLWVANDTIVS